MYVVTVSDEKSRNEFAVMPFQHGSSLSDTKKTITMPEHITALQLVA
jgi:hypothetical protein